MRASRPGLRARMVPLNLEMSGMQLLGTDTGKWARSPVAIEAGAAIARAAAQRTTREQRVLRKDRDDTVKRWSHKNNGTVETHEAHRRRRPGAIARLYASGYLTDDELAWSQEIAAIAAKIMADAGLRTCSMETRVDSSRHGDAFFEALGAVWNEIAYSRWRAQLGGQAAMVLDIVVHDIGLARAAADHGMHVRRARKLLVDALHLWMRIHSDVRREVTPADLAAAHAGIL
ncbi:MAG: hypothetical protein ABIV36_12150 [Sphingobium limneticum]